MAKKNMQGVNIGVLSEGGGLFLDGSMGRILSAKFVMFDYGRKSKPAPVAWLQIQEDGADELREQAYSVGDADKWAISNDADQLIRVADDGKGIPKNSNFGIFIQALTEAGFPTDKFDASISKTLNGLYGKWKQYKPHREGIDTKNAKGYDRTYPVISEIAELPGGQAAAGAGAAAGGDITQLTVDAIKAAIANGPQALSQLAGVLMSNPNVAGSPNQGQVIAAAMNTQFLTEGANAGHWNFANGIVSAK